MRKRYTVWTINGAFHFPFVLHSRAVARSEIFGGLVLLGGDNVSPLVEIGLADLPNIGGAKAPQPPPCDGPVTPSHFTQSERSWAGNFYRCGAIVVSYEL